MKRLKVSFHHLPLHFKFEAQTSRNTLRIKDSWIVELEDHEGNRGYGECGPIWGLSPESEAELKSQMEVYSQLDSIDLNPISHLPSLRFGLETAMLDLESEGHILFESEFSAGVKGIPINGLIWMGDIDWMKKQIASKLDLGFTCLKLKVGAQNLDDELQVLQGIRKSFPPEQLEIRLDANGAYTPENALSVLERFTEYSIHSIEQPIQPGKWPEMAKVTQDSPIAIALDEELISVYDLEKKKQLLEEINPQYIILKPSLLGGLKACDEWISLAESQNVGWWATSMLESNVGLNAIAQWVATKGPEMKQGLGTGQLYSNNIPSPLEIRGEELWMGKDKWQIESSIQSSINSR